MESYWCMKKNSITNWILYGIDFDSSLIPCIKTECENWSGGMAGASTYGKWRISIFIFRRLFEIFQTIEILNHSITI
jgi:hypothetical protein